jgi:ADP-ribosylglycohydrolase
MANDLRISDGAAMKVAPAGWFHAGRLVDAVHTAASLCVPTHNSHIAFAGAGCVAAAVSIATAGGDLPAILDAALAGATVGCELGLRMAIEVPAPSMTARVGLAIDVARGEGDAAFKVARLADLIGSGLPITEAVPMAIGLVAVLGDDPMELIRTTVNLGSDADTVASIAAAIAGTRTGLAGFDDDLIRQLEQTNGIDIVGIGASIAAASAAPEEEEPSHAQ